MKDSNARDKPNRTGEETPNASQDSSLASYPPDLRRAILKGMDILAEVAVRTYMEEQASESFPPESQEHGGEQKDD